MAVPAPLSASLVRHGATEWSESGKHTSTTDLPLLPEGEDEARRVASRLVADEYAEVWTSPMRRARRTAEIAGFGDAEVVPDLVEWGYGDYEGRSTLEIREQVPGWTVWTHGCPGGESAEDLAQRCDRVVERIRATSGPVLIFAHGQSLRALAARWIGLAVVDGRHFRLDTATVSQLGYERETPVLLHWNA